MVVTSTMILSMSWHKQRASKAFEAGVTGAAKEKAAEATVARRERVLKRIVKKREWGGKRV